MRLILGEHSPMSHQSEDVMALEPFSRVNIWNGLGTGKMNTGAWLSQLWWMSGRLDEIVVIAPSMCAPDWMDTFASKAWPDGLCDVVDCRPPDSDALVDCLTSPIRQHGGRCRVMATTYATLRKFVGSRSRKGARYSIDHAGGLAKHMRGKRLGVVFDESQAAALQSSDQGSACAAFASWCSCVISMTATPIGNPLAMRLWGMARLVRPDILAARDVDNFLKFKARYGNLVDPQQSKDPTGRTPFSIMRAFPTSIKDDLIQSEILGPMAPFTVHRRKEDCLDLPPKVYMGRTCRLPAKVLKMMRDLAEDDRTILESGSAVVVKNALEERLRVLELCGGFVSGEPIHDAKLRLLKDVLSEIDGNLGDRSPGIVWASRTKEVLAVAIALSTGDFGMDSMILAARAATDTSLYKEVVARAVAGGVAVINGLTPERGHMSRDYLQDEWKRGRLRFCVAHPGVAGAGLNWQHAVWTAYFTPPHGTLSRQQSEDRVHRHGLKHTALYYDLTVEGGPDHEVNMAHRRQRSVAQSILSWMGSLSSCIRG